MRGVLQPESDATMMAHATDQIRRAGHVATPEIVMQEPWRNKIENVVLQIEADATMAAPVTGQIEKKGRQMLQQQRT
jgi:hypothetical protein